MGTENTKTEIHGYTDVKIQRYTDTRYRDAGCEDGYVDTYIF